MDNSNEFKLLPKEVELSNEVKKLTLENTTLKQQIFVNEVLSNKSKEEKDKRHFQILEVVIDIKQG